MDYSKIDKSEMLAINSRTLHYRLKSFINACNMTSFMDNYNMLINGYEYPELGDYVERPKKQANLTWDYDEKIGDVIFFSGTYDNLKFMFANYLRNDKNTKKINNLPCYVKLVKTINDVSYELNIKTMDAPKHYFKLVKNESVKVEFYANILEFSKILNIVRAFVNDPEKVFNTYYEIIGKKIKTITNGDLNKVIEKEGKIEEPGNKFVKKIKMITNND